MTGKFLLPDQSNDSDTADRVCWVNSSKPISSKPVADLELLVEWIRNCEAYSVPPTRSGFPDFFDQTGPEFSQKSGFFKKLPN